ncbi:MAG: FAD-dependent oxidoreductase [Proteobacteria bacterium]|nr:FAD-dependent oxidoreductase [Pseudomonadota bacterium]MBU1737692.1 FAD-dependent oxidoreductase [Pseudomonadota bacterium]
MNSRVLIIGGVAAGPKTACRLKRVLPEADITIIDQDNLISYGGCGIPYYVSGDVSDEKELRNTSFHMTRDEAFFLNAKGVNVLTRTKALSIDRINRKVNVLRLDSGTEENLSFDKLVLCTGASPVILPIPGAELDGVFTISDLHKAIAIKDRLAKGQIGKAVIIGGGAIGVEMAESFADLWGVETTLIEFMPILLPNILDPVFSAMLATHLRQHGVNVFTGEGVRAIEADNNGRACRVITDARTVDADIVIMAAGVRPRSDLAREAGLLVSPRGGIIVNNRLQTSDPDIYAAGDCIETTHLLSGKKCHAPMGSLANRQGRIVADNLAGIPSQFNGWGSSFILKAFDICVGATGLNLAAARAEGFAADAVITAQSDRAHFFPEQSVIPLQMIFDRQSRRILGLQGFGPMGDAVLARIDAAAALIARGGTIDDCSQLDLAYAPPFATALDALNATANVADNKACNRLRTVSIEDYMAWMTDPGTHPDWLALDIRHPNESSVFVNNFSNIWRALPYIEIRSRFNDLPKEKTLIIICDAGTRSYEVQCFLDHHGFDSLVLGGGFNCIRRIGAEWWPAG